MFNLIKILRFFLIFLCILIVMYIPKELKKNKINDIPSRFDLLPIEVIRCIYEFDPTYKNILNVSILKINSVYLYDFCENYNLNRWMNLQGGIAPKWFNKFCQNNSSFYKYILNLEYKYKDKYY